MTMLRKMTTITIELHAGPLSAKTLYVVLACGKAMFLEKHVILFVYSHMDPMFVQRVHEGLF